MRDIKITSDGPSHIMVIRSKFSYKSNSALLHKLVKLDLGLLMLRTKFYQQVCWVIEVNKLFTEILLTVLMCLSNLLSI